jgi:hypothetical protein
LGMWNILRDVIMFISLSLIPNVKEKI